MIAFEIDGGEKEAFLFLNHLKLIKLAVSLGSTESLVQHPATMTHIGVCPILKQKIGITDGLVRLSVGVENVEDLINDIANALSHCHQISVERDSTSVTDENILEIIA
jgi:methionine-gamma-lyase